jgi:hypothetical protein
MEVNHYSDLEINNFKGTSAPGNKEASPVLLINGTGFKTNLNEKLVRIKQK